MQETRFAQKAEQSCLPRNAVAEIFTRQGTTSQSFPTASAGNRRAIIIMGARAALLVLVTLGSCRVSGPLVTRHVNQLTRAP